MKKIIVTYGLVAGFVVICVMIAGIEAAGTGGLFASEWFGYLVMLVALSLIFVGVKRYRDAELAGVIRFGQAFALGLGISAMAGVIYVAVWEVYLASTDYSFMNDYVAGLIEAKRSAGLTGAELQAEIDAAESLQASYAKPWVRLPVTFLEIFPVGVLVSVMSAAILRNPRVLPAQQADTPMAGG